MRAVLIALALAASFVPFIPSARAQVDPQAVALTSADVPSTLRVGRSGTTSRGGGPAYEIFFDVSDPMRVADSGAIVQVANVVAVPNDPSSGLNEFINSVRGQASGGLVEQGPQPVGEESRSFTGTFGVGPFSGSMAGAVFRRGNTVVAVLVRSTGSTPALAEAVQFAQLVDLRLAPPAAAVAAP